MHGATLRGAGAAPREDAGACDSSPARAVTHSTTSRRVIEKQISCRCGESIENRDLEGVDVKVHRCGSCGAQVGPEAEQCDFCGSAIVRDEGVLSLICPECYGRNEERRASARPAASPSRRSRSRRKGSSCPAPAAGGSCPCGQIGGVGINECPGAMACGRRGQVRSPGRIRRRGEQSQQRSGEAAQDAPRVKGSESRPPAGALPQVPRVRRLHAAAQLPQGLGRHSRSLRTARHLARCRRARADRGLHPERRPPRRPALHAGARGARQPTARRSPAGAARRGDRPASSLENTQPERSLAGPSCACSPSCSTEPNQSEEWIPWP